MQARSSPASLCANDGIIFARVKARSDGHHEHAGDIGVAAIADEHLRFGNLNPRGEDWVRELDENLANYRAKAQAFDEMKAPVYGPHGEYTLGHADAMRELADDLAGRGIISAADREAAERAAISYGKVGDAGDGAASDRAASDGNTAGRLGGDSAKAKGCALCSSISVI
jgi:hypothetical protein